MFFVALPAAAFLGQPGPGFGPALAFGLCIASPVLYWALMQSSARQATLGKSLLGMKVVRSDGERLSFGRSLGRELAKYLSSIPLMIGFLLAAFTARKQALHDMVASTVVVREGPSHTLVALLVGVFGWFAPALIVMFVGASLIAGMMGVVGGTMREQPMHRPQMQQPVHQAAAPRPLPATVLAAPSPRTPASPAAAPTGSVPVMAQAAKPMPAKAFIGVWRNEDPQTRSITRLEIASDGAALKIHMWGKCHPSDCDWGEISRPYGDLEGGVLLPSWPTSFKVEEQRIVPLANGRLEVRGNLRFTDNSGRPPRHYTDRFVLAEAASPAITPPSSPEAPQPSAETKPRPEPPPAQTAQAGPVNPSALKMAEQPLVPLALAAAPALPSPKYNDLMTAVMMRDGAAVDELLRLGKWVDKPDSYGTTPLVVAVRLRDAATAESLLKAGADPDRALRAAREQADPAMVSLLERYGRK